MLSIVQGSGIGPVLYTVYSSDLKAAGKDSVLVKYADDTSAVTIIVVTIFIATFQNYRIVFLSRHFLCVRNDIFAWYLRYANMIDSPPVYSSFSMLQSCFNHVPRTTWRVIATRRPWLSSVSVRERRRNCLWSNVSLVVSVARVVFMMSQLTITSMCLRCRFQVSVLSSVSMGN